MELEWTGSGYRLGLCDKREAHLVRDLMIEASYIVHKLPDAEQRLRLGVGPQQLQKAIDDWEASKLTKVADVVSVELIRASWFEALDFFSEAEFQLRTGWPREEARALFAVFLEARRQITITRQWGPDQ